MARLEQGGSHDRKYKMQILLHKHRITIVSLRQDPCVKPHCPSKPHRLTGNHATGFTEPGIRNSAKIAKILLETNLIKVIYMK